MIAEISMSHPPAGSLLSRVVPILERCEALDAELRTMTAARDALLEMPTKGLLAADAPGWGRIVDKCDAILADLEVGVKTDATR